MQNLQVFNNTEFGEVRVLEQNGEPWFVGKDVAEILGYAEPRSAVSKKVDSEDRGVAKMETPSGIQEMTIVNESGLYSLILSSKLPQAKQFKRWVTSEVLPTLRKTGSYEMPKQEKPNKRHLSSVNMTAKIMRDTLKDAGCDKKYIAVAVGNLYRSEAGIDFGVPLIANVPELWDCTSIAKHFGIYSKTGNPHDKAASAIIQKLDAPDKYIVKVPYERNGHPGVTVQYTKEVLEMVKQWLENSGYPRTIEYRLSNGNVNKCKVVYREVA